MKRCLVINILGILLLPVEISQSQEISAPLNDVAYEQNDDAYHTVMDAPPILSDSIQKLSDAVDEEKPTVKFFHVPCTCKEFVCDCCVNKIVDLFFLHTRNCFGIHYRSSSNIFDISVLYNNVPVINGSISGIENKPFCFPWPQMDVLQACMDIEGSNLQTKCFHAPIGAAFGSKEVVTLTFDCLHISQFGLEPVSSNARSMGPAYAIGPSRESKGSHQRPAGGSTNEDEDDWEEVGEWQNGDTEETTGEWENLGEWEGGIEVFESDILKAIRQEYGDDDDE